MNVEEEPVVRHRYTFKRFLHDVVPVLQAKERAGVAPYYFVFVHKGRKDFLDLWGPTDKVLAALREVARDAIPLEDLFTHVRIYRSSKDAHRNFVDPMLIDRSFSNIGANRTSDTLFRHKMYVFDTALDEREAAGLPSMSHNVREYVLPKYLGGRHGRSPRRKTRRARGNRSANRKSRRRQTR